MQTLVYTIYVHTVFYWNSCQSIGSIHSMSEIDKLCAIFEIGGSLVPWELRNSLILFPSPLPSASYHFFVPRILSWSSKEIGSRCIKDNIILYPEVDGLFSNLVYAFSKQSLSLFNSIQDIRTIKYWPNYDWIYYDSSNNMINDTSVKIQLINGQSKLIGSFAPKHYLWGGRGGICIASTINCSWAYGLPLYLSFACIIVPQLNISVCPPGLTMMSNTIVINPFAAILRCRHKLWWSHFYCHSSVNACIYRVSKDYYR